MNAERHACATPEAIETLGRDGRECYLADLARVLGGRLSMAAFGGHVAMHNADGFPVGYRFLDSDGIHGLQVWLDWDDTFTVERIGDGKVLGSVDQVYVDQVADIAWQASCFRDTTFGSHDPSASREDA